MNNYKNNVKLHIKLLKVRTGFIMKLVLKHRGKSDGKHGIPNYNADCTVISPFIKKEHDIVYSYMGYVIKTLDEHNALYYHDYESMIAEFTSKINKAIKFSAALKNIPDEASLYIPTMKLDTGFEDYLSSKREAEKELDTIGIRQRRFEEYQQKVRIIRKKFSTLCSEITELYQSIMVCIDNIKQSVNTVPPVFWKAQSEVDICLSWYWEGVLLKHPKASTLPQIVPDPDYSRYDTYIVSIQKEIGDMKEKTLKMYEHFENSI